MQQQVQQNCVGRPSYERDFFFNLTGITSDQIMVQLKKKKKILNSHFVTFHLHTVHLTAESCNCWLHVTKHSAFTFPQAQLFHCIKVNNVFSISKCHFSIYVYLVASWILLQNWMCVFSRFAGSAISYTTSRFLHVLHPNKWHWTVLTRMNWFAICSCQE